MAAPVNTEPPAGRTTTFVAVDDRVLPRLQTWCRMAGIELRPTELGGVVSYALVPATAEALVSARRRLGLSEREVEVLQGIAAGHTNGEIAERLFVSTDTVKTHVQRLLAKLGVGDRSAAVNVAWQNGLLGGAR
ncbi:response regulator transcription factor [Prauserella muralis]|uniref:Uncharacterized protein n=1 Tax=Prauserella muralis TaxID=588067 RepID=A0A2V4B079_9PSEU|nr:response regulator transcription factor [Prauserella muralis]PXY27407.1 hypothetical protein BAY60_13310 [Prauserella muralis]TWE22896.1 regulatory LuxR family protein [Prauserella muralis]